MVFLELFGPVSNIQALDKSIPSPGLIKNFFQFPFLVYRKLGAVPRRRSTAPRLFVTEISRYLT